MAEPGWPPLPERGPFALGDRDAYRRWRDAKLAAAPTRVEELVVEVADPRSLTEAEHAALLDRCRRANMALYASPTGGEADPMIAVRLGEQFGLVHLDHNPGADERGITALTYVPGSRYIPYSNRPIHWHTDGYYNRPDRQIRGMLLHCVAQAGEGGESGLLDHELAYIAVRDADEALYAALCEPDVMTIPGNRGDPRVMRPDRSGPVFWVDPETGTLQMRYTARARNIVWKAEPQVAAARELLARLPETSPHCLRATLQPGWGLLCNNVLHDRTGFLDQEGEPHRLLYRGRYYDRIAGT